MAITIQATGSTSILIGFNEPAGLLPTDVAGGLLDLVVPATASEPARVEGVLGGARYFDGALRGYVALEKTVGQTKLHRTMSIEAVLHITASESLTRTIVQRGKGDSAAERLLWALKINFVSGTTWSLQMAWQRASGAAATVPAANFTMPSDGIVYVAAVRRWKSLTSVDVDYYVNGIPIGTINSAHGDIQDGDGGTTLVGLTFGGGVYLAGFFLDYLDELRVSSTELTAEDVEHQHRRLFLYAKHGGELLRALLPPGEAYSTDPTTIIQRELAVEGDGMGEGLAQLEELRQYFLPDRASRALDRWEQVTRLAPGPLDDMTARRKRVLGHLRKVWGYSRADIVKAVYQLLGLTEAQVEIVETSNTTKDTAWIPGAYTQEPNAGTIAGGGQLNTAYQIGDDATWTGSVRKAVALRKSIPEAAECEWTVYPDMGASALPANGDELCAFLFNFITGDAHLFGIRNDAGTKKFFQTTIIAGVLTRTTYAAIPVGDVYLRMKRLAAGTVDLQYNQTGLETAWTTVAAAAPSITGPTWAGMGVVDELTPAVSNVDVFWNWAHLYCPKTTRVFEWYVWADPALTATPDVVGAQQIIDRMRPAHTDGKVIRSKALLCDDPNNFLDRDPLGS